MDTKFKDWQTALGICSTEDTEPSYFLQSLAEANIIGMITDAQAESLLLNYLEDHNITHHYLNDVVILKIKRFLAIDSFDLSVEFFFSVHKYIFTGVSSDNGILRNRHISRKEACLGGETVIYAAPDEIMTNLHYDFAKAKKDRANYRNYDFMISSLANFVSNIWQAHPFCDGNTRCTSVFLEKYLRYMGYETNNNIFKDNALYFRNALVRSNPTTCPKLHTTNEYLLKFFEKVLVNPTLELDPHETYLSLSR